MKIYLDFDGTVVEHQYPKIGRCNFGCFEVIKRLQDAGHEIVLNTYRSDIGGDHLNEALRMVNEQSYAFIKDRSQRKTFKLNPIKATERKIHPDRFCIEDTLRTNTLFIDDQAKDTPLKLAVMSSGNMVDWDALDKIFSDYQIY